MSSAPRFFLAAALLMPATALAAGFTDDKATVLANGNECKKTTVQFVPASGEKSGKLIVSGGKKECKKLGFAKSIGDLSDVTWNDKDRKVDFSIKGGATYSITIKSKSDYKMIRDALVDAV